MDLNNESASAASEPTSSASQPSDGGENTGATEEQTPHARLSAFESRRQARIDRLRDRADRKQAEGQSQLNRANAIASYIPPGQPILVGHHSEKRHRRDLDRIHNSTRNGLNAMKEAQRLSDRADAAESSTAIFADDPKAPDKLEEKIAKLVKYQERMREVNKRIRGNKSLSDLGITAEEEAKLKTPDFARRIGYPDYELKNNNANIRRLKTRLAFLKTQQAAPTPVDIEKDGIRIVENVDENRVQIFFPAKPSEDLRDKLKGYGFRWAPYNKCWQRHRSSAATHWAKVILDTVNSEVA